MLRHVEIVEEAYDPEMFCGQFRTQLNLGANAGAIVTFTGIARHERDSDDPVEKLLLQHYPGVTEQQIEAAAAKAGAQFQLSGVSIVHRVGVVRPGAPIVTVAAASAHRRSAFDATDYLMDYLKTAALFWKKEYRRSGARWIEPRGEDHLDAARWRASVNSICANDHKERGHGGH